MSIKIIKNTMTEPIEMTCPVCKSIFSYTYEDIQRKHNSSLLASVYDYDSTIRFIICPVCKSDIDMSTNLVLKDGGKEE